MNNDDAPVMLVYPPDLSDESVQAVGEFLRELSNSFERHYFVQLRRLLDTQDCHGLQCLDNEADIDPF
jgi:hypothetical protein